MNLENQTKTDKMKDMYEYISMLEKEIDNCVCCQELEKITRDNLNDAEELAKQIKEYFGLGTKAHY